jgi:hypothetical protein
LKLTHDEHLSKFAFDFNLRRYSAAIDGHDTVFRMNNGPTAGFEKFVVRRCSLTLSDPRCERLELGD